MNFEFDLFGWYEGTSEEPGLRTTTEAPANTSTSEAEGELRANWTGAEWVDVPYAAPPVPTEPEVDPRIWWVDVGPFKDRLGMDIGAIAASQHSACLGVKEFLNGRKYVNLRDPKVALLLDVMIANNQPAADPVWPGSGPITVAKKAAILDTPTSEEERHIKGLEG